MEIKKIPAIIALESTILDIAGIGECENEDVNAIAEKINNDEINDSEAMMNHILSLIGEQFTDHVSVSSVGYICVGEHQLELVYNEDEESGMKGSETRMVFDPDNRGLVSMIRNGESNASLVFDIRQRQICLYDTGIGDPFELAVVTRKVDNGITEQGGRLVLEYLIEIGGSSAEYSKVEVTAVPTNESEQGNPTVIEYEKP